MKFVEPIRDKNKIEKVKQVLLSKSIRDFLIFEIGVNSGLRISDLLALKVKDVAHKKYLEIKERKTGKNKRFPLNQVIIEKINEFIKNKNPENYLFCGQNTHQLSRVQAYRIIKNACQKVGVNERIGTHSLRKTFGYHFYKSNKDIALLQNILNHSSPNITLRYIGINQDIIDSSLKSFYL